MEYIWEESSTQITESMTTPFFKGFKGGPECFGAWAASIVLLFSFDDDLPWHPNKIKGTNKKQTEYRMMDYLNITASYFFSKLVV